MIICTCTEKDTIQTHNDKPLIHRCTKGTIHLIHYVHEHIYYTHIYTPNSPPPSLSPLPPSISTSPPLYLPLPRSLPPSITPSLPPSLISLFSLSLYFLTFSPSLPPSLPLNLTHTATYMYMYIILYTSTLSTCIVYQYTHTHTYMSDNGQKVHVRSFQCLSTGQDIAEGVVVTGRSERKMGQGSELCVVPAIVQTQAGVALGGIQLVSTATGYYTTLYIHVCTTGKYIIWLYSTVD